MRPATHVAQVAAKFGVSADTVARGRDQIAANVTDDELRDYAERRGITVEAAADRLAVLSAGLRAFIDIHGVPEDDAHG